MKICFVFKEYPVFDNPKSSGVGNSIYHVSQGLSKNHSVYILTQTDTTQTIYQGKVSVFSVRRVHLPSLIDKRFIRWCMCNIRTFFSLMHLYRIYKFDIIEFGNWEFEGMLFVPVCLLLRLPVKLVCRLHTGTYDIALYDRRLKRSVAVLHALESWAMRLPNMFLTTSTKDHARHCRKEYQLGNKDINIIPLGIAPIQSRRAGTRVNLLTRDEQKILYVGRIEYRKGITTLLRSIPIVLRKNPNAVFYIVGDGVLPIFPMIQKYVPFCLWQNIRYFGYVDSAEQLSLFYQQADLCVFPSWYESFGFTILEAMRYRKAVISTVTGGIPEVITDGMDGILVPPKNHTALATAIIHLLHDNPFRKKIGVAGAKTVATRFSQRMFTRNTERFYQSLLR